MNVSCNIVRDLLPLYAEGLVSPDTEKMVHDHLITCNTCTKELAMLKKPLPLPVMVDSRKLYRLRNAIWRRFALGVIAVSAVVMLAVWLCCYMSR